MSILKRFLVEDIVPLLRRSSPEELRGRLAPAAAGEVEERKPNSTAAAYPGRRVVLLNWRIGENDPFTVVNAAMAQHFRACGKNVEVIEISEDNWPARLAEFGPGGVEFALTWQGLGSPVTVGQGESLWDHLRIPLICIHGDHPCHMPVRDRQSACARRRCL